MLRRVLVVVVVAEAPVDGFPSVESCRRSVDFLPGSEVDDAGGGGGCDDGDDDDGDESIFIHSGILSSPLR